VVGVLRLVDGVVLTGDCSIRQIAVFRLVINLLFSWLMVLGNVRVQVGHNFPVKKAVLVDLHVLNRPVPFSSLQLHSSHQSI